MGQTYNITFLYTPFIRYNIDFELQYPGAFKDDLVEQPVNFSHSHSYIKEDTFNKILKFDKIGSKLAEKYAWGENILRSMTFERGYYELMVGSVTLDSYKIIETGISYIMDCTHGYHKTTVHLATSFPGTSKVVNNPISVFPHQVWLAIAFSLNIFCLCTLNMIYIYGKIRPQLLKANLESTHVMLRLYPGCTEPDQFKWFKDFSAGRLVLLVFSFSGLFLIAIYNVDLRSKLIVPGMETSIDSLDDIDFGKTKILLHYDEGTKLTISDQIHLTDVVPFYRWVQAKSIQVLPYCIHFTQFYPALFK